MEHKKTKQNNTNSVIVQLCYIAIIVLILMRDILGLSLSRYIFIGLALFICLLTDIDGLFCLATFICPMHTGISGTFIIIFICAFYLIKKRRFSLSLGSIVSILLIIALELASALRGNFAIGDFIRFSCYFLFFSFSLLDEKQTLPGEKMLIYFSVGMLTAIASLFGQMLKHYSFANLLQLGIRFGNTMQVTNSEAAMLISFNQNDLGTLCAFLLSCALYLFFKKKQLFWIPVGCIGILVCFMTQSRSGILTLLLIIAGFFIFTAKNAKKAFFWVLGGIALIAISIQLINKLMPAYYKSFMKRMEDADLSNGRIDIMIFYLKEIMSHIDRFIFGVGLQNYSDKFGYPWASHMMALEIWIAWGIIGLLDFIWIFVKIYKTTVRKVAQFRFVNTIPFFVELLDMQTGQGFSGWHHFIYFMITLAFIYLEDSQIGIPENEHI